MAGTSVRVLLVDRDANSVRRIRRMLAPSRAPGVRVRHAPDLSTATHRLKRGRYEVVLLNLATVEVSGLAALAVLRSVAPAVPVVALAPLSHESEALKAVRAGAHDHLIIDRLYETLLIRSIQHAREHQRAAERQRAAEASLRESERRYRTLFEQSAEAILITDQDGTIIDVNPAAVALLHYSFNELIGRPFATLSDEESGTVLDEVSAAGTAEIEMRLRRKGGEVLWCILGLSARIRDDGCFTGYQAILHDITIRKLAEERLARKAFHDPLTGLANRLLLMDRIELALARYRRNPDHRCAVLFLDIDRFKDVNDRLGHRTGDELLVRIGELLTSCMREEDTIARLGGDEFVVLLDRVANERDAERAAERIQEQFLQPLTILDRQPRVSASIGIALAEPAIRYAADLLDRADAAMYRAKAVGVGQYALYVAPRPPS